MRELTMSSCVPSSDTLDEDIQVSMCFDLAHTHIHTHTHTKKLDQHSLARSLTFRQALSAKIPGAASIRRHLKKKCISVKQIQPPRARRTI